MKHLGSPDLNFSLSPLQFSSRSEAPDSNQQLQQAVEERAQLEKHVGQVGFAEGGIWEEDGSRWPGAGNNQ